MFEIETSQLFNSLPVLSQVTRFNSVYVLFLRGSIVHEGWYPNDP